MNKLLLFTLLSIPVIYISRKNLMHPKTHGFFRFLGWECILLLLVFNYRFWFYKPFSATQLISWILLFAGLYTVIAGVLKLKNAARTAKRNEKGLFDFEKTAELVDDGIYRFIRHPLYASLIYLTWGIFLKNPVLLLLPVALLATFLFYLTARMDEKECTGYFGEAYRLYMNRSKMFIPLIF